MTAIGKTARALGLGGWIVLGAGLLASGAHAQPAPTDTAALDQALRTLAQNPQSGAALIAAGEASLRLDDVDAAEGFFHRAEAINPQDPRLKAGLAAAMVHRDRPLEALGLFAQAGQAGALSVNYLAERGLAYDLIGDNARAQQDYKTALSAGADPIVTRRLALSQAIAGDQRSAEATLLPLLQHTDLAAYRTRAFALAIMGRGDEAVSIAETMLPAALSNRMAPYLRYMPRLTRAQQAAAANLGAFPRAGDIGRDDPAIMAYAARIGVPAPPTAQSADSRLVPSGTPLGSPSGVRRREVRVAAAVPAPTPTPPPPVVVAQAAPPPAAPAPQIAASAPAPQQTRAPVVHSGAPAELPERARAMLEQHPELAISRNVRPPAAQPATSPLPSPTGAELARIRTAQQAPAPPQPTPAPPPFAVAAEEPALQPVIVAREEPPPQAPSLAPEQPGPQQIAVAPSEAAARPPAPVSPPPAAVPGPEIVNVRDAFADLRAPEQAPVAAAASGAVDITKIKPRRDTPPKPPAPPPVPSREWVQVATGRSTKALAFDWKRIKREGGAALAKQNPSTAKWGQTNRLVIGPFASAEAADKTVEKLKDKKLDAFRFTSDEGEEVKPLPTD